MCEATGAAILATVGRHRGEQAKYEKNEHIIPVRYWSYFGASYNIGSFWTSDPPRIAVVSVACMPVGHGAWKASEPLSDLDQLLSIVKHDPNVNAEQVVSVCNTQQRLVHPLPHTSQTRCPRWDAPPWPRWERSQNACHTMTQTSI